MLQIDICLSPFAHTLPFLVLSGHLLKRSRSWYIDFWIPCLYDVYNRHAHNLHAILPVTLPEPFTWLVEEGVVILRSWSAVDLLQKWASSSRA
jgi:hypothetical protein